MVWWVSRVHGIAVTRNFENKDEQFRFCVFFFLIVCYAFCDHVITCCYPLVSLLGPQTVKHPAWTENSPWNSPFSVNFVWKCFFLTQHNNAVFKNSIFSTSHSCPVYRWNSRNTFCRFFCMKQTWSDVIIARKKVHWFHVREPPVSSFLQCILRVLDCVHEHCIVTRNYSGILGVINKWTQSEFFLIVCSLIGEKKYTFIRFISYLRLRDVKHVQNFVLQRTLTHISAHVYQVSCKIYLLPCNAFLRT